MGARSRRSFFRSVPWGPKESRMIDFSGRLGYHFSMRSMFQMGFEREVFSERHPNMGVSFGDLQSWWKTNYPLIKADIKPATTTPIPGTLPIAQTTLTPRVAVAPAPSSGGSTALWVGGLAVLGLGAYWMLARRPFGFKKK